MSCHGDATVQQAQERPTAASVGRTAGLPSVVASVPPATRHSRIGAPLEAQP